ncbi:metallophosphoesterase [Sedimentibacter sp. zth1]|uniref:metallophosphoesterase n=1 Tax=Sedimentibacter sp. zth1 TaxID=2816908 RepID=UPI001A9180BA|nr:metallophosphoesterase [Sedimentibacter sp. zth1]QSX06459.1 metallophosphoesterase [Sedimentibacter sp. zth1]
MRRLKKKRIIIVSLLIILVLITLLAFDVRLKVQEYTVISDKITLPVKVALITDLHSCKYGDNEMNLIKAIDKQNPDVILMGGDICDDKLPNDNTELLLKGIADKYPCFYVSGNHEYWSGEIDKIKSMFRLYNVDVLEGTSSTINIRGQNINICGMDDPDVEKYIDNNNMFYSQLEALEKISDNGYYTILLAHRPQYVNMYLQYGFDMVLSGHTHGGQWRIPVILNGLYAPDQEWFPKYAGGEYDFANGKMIVSRGLSRESTRVPRIFNRPELVIINLENSVSR